MNEYQQSLKIQRDNNSTLSYVKKEGVNEGIAEGKHKKAVKMALKLKIKGISLYEISELTDLSVEEVKSL